jgi:cytochrome b involved in lipid metabolism
MTNLSEKRIVMMIDHHYFDVTDYADQHPGGRRILEKYHGKDATRAFEEIRGHGESIVTMWLEKMEISKEDYLFILSKK